MINKFKNIFLVLTLALGLSSTGQTYTEQNNALIYPLYIIEFAAIMRASYEGILPLLTNISKTKKNTVKPFFVCDKHWNDNLMNNNETTIRTFNGCTNCQREMRKTAKGFSAIFSTIVTTIIGSKINSLLADTIIKNCNYVK